MSRSADNQARMEAMLGEFAELSLMVAKDLAVAVRETPEAAEKAALAGAFEKVGRSLRLTLALVDKLERDAARDAAEDARVAREAEAEAVRLAKFQHIEDLCAPKAREPEGPIEIRKARVVSLVKRFLWNESEGEDETYDILTEELDARLDEAARNPQFLDLPLETLAKRILTDFGITAPFALSLGEPKPPPTPVRELQTADTG